MGISIKQWLLKKFGKESGGSASQDMELLAAAAQEYRIRELAFFVCVDMIAAAVGRCEFKTLHKGAAIFGNEYYLWNVEPNQNQNSTAFLHKLICQLFRHNEALVVSTRPIKGLSGLMVAEGFTQEDKDQPDRPNRYSGVVLDGVQVSRVYEESEVLHFSLNHLNIKPVLDAMSGAFSTMMDRAMKEYNWNAGKHLKVHITQTAQKDPEFQKKFGEMLTEQIKPYFDSENALLPEFEGYEYENFGNVFKNGQAMSNTTRDIRALVDDIFDFTARAFLIPPVLLRGEVAGTEDAIERWLSTCIDPLCDQLQEEINRKRYGREEFISGSRMWIDSSSITHFDMFKNAGNVEKLIGSGAYSVNDVLEAAGSPPRPEDWARAHWMTRNISPIEEALSAIEMVGKATPTGR